MSAEGVQQGDPLGPLLFCLAIHRHCSQMRSPLYLMYLDDVTIAGAVDNILHDLEVIKEAKTLDLTLNSNTSEIISVDATVRGTILCSIPGAKTVSPEKATLLGSPLSNVTSIDDALLDKSTALQRMGARFKYLAAHDSLVLLHHSFALPRLHYLLHTAP